MNSVVTIPRFTPGFLLEKSICCASSAGGCTDTADKSVFLAHKKPRFRVVLNGAPQAVLYGYGGQVRFLGAQKTTLSRGFKWCAQQESNLYLQLRRLTTIFYSGNRPSS